MIRSSSLAAIAERVAVVEKQEDKAQPEVKLIRCSHCKLEREMYAGGMCSPCHRYKRRTGILRPFKLIQRESERQSAPKWCKTCGSPNVFAGLRCEACYSYLLRTGKPRPKRFWNDDFCCTTCGYPKSAKTKGTSRTFVVDKCVACYKYERRHKKPRPEYLWGKGKHGWCMCGRQANYQKDGFNLCTICAEK